MEFWIFIGLALFISSNSEIKNRLAKLERKRKDKGGINMSKIIENLIGMKCKITEGTGVMNYECFVLEVDEEWVKLKVVNKKNEESIVIKRIDVIRDITILDNKEAV